MSFMRVDLRWFEGRGEIGEIGEIKGDVSDGGTWSVAL
jgi:hypothetical protein